MTDSHVLFLINKLVSQHALFTFFWLFDLVFALYFEIGAQTFALSLC